MDDNKYKLSDTLKQQVISEYDKAEDKMEFLRAFREWLHTDLSPLKHQPVDGVRWVNIDDVVANNYNPNSVAVKEMALLHKSIQKDGYTQPVVVVWDGERKKYVIVDGFHRTTIMKTYKDIQESTNRLLPVVVIEKDMNERMAATVRHNRARGTHSVVSMSDMVFAMSDRGMDEASIANELGMEAEEVKRLQYITGFAKLFEDKEYSKVWETKRQILLRKEYEAKSK